MIASLYLPLVLLSAVGGIGLALFAWLHRETPGAAPLSLFLLAASVWSLADALSVASSSGVVWWAFLKYAISTLLPLSWLLVVFEYTGRERWLAGPRLLVLVVEPILFSALIWTNDAHHAVWTTTRVINVEGYWIFAGSEGLAFWGHMVYAYALVVIGAASLVSVLLRTEGVFRDQSTALLAAIVLPMVVNALYVFDMLGIDVDPTGVAFVLSGVILVAAMLRQHLLAVAPATRDLGREKVIEQLDDPVCIVDAGGTVVDFNPAAESLLEVPAEDAIGRDLAAIEPTLADAGASEEVTLERGGVRRYYDVSVSELDRARGAVTGRIVSLRDVTERTRREQRLEVMHRLFRHNLRNEMNVVQGNAELLRENASEPTPQGRAEKIIDIVDEVIGRSDKIGAISGAIDDESTRPLDLASVLSTVVDSFRAEYPRATFAVDAPETCPVIGDPSIEVAVRELIENALEHADRSDPTVDIALSVTEDDCAELTVSDDGPGIPEQELQVLEAGTETPMRHGSGIGLWLVTWTVERAGGSIDFETGEEGTTATVRLPCA
ncbi:MAG: histidine kinase N-terminal 7TM domain-containing protein [Halapricum sp.]